MTSPVKSNTNSDYDFFPFNLLLFWWIKKANQQQNIWLNEKILKFLTYICLSLSPSLSKRSFFYFTLVVDFFSHKMRHSFSSLSSCSLAFSLSLLFVRPICEMHICLSSWSHRASTLSLSMKVSWCENRQVKWNHLIYQELISTNSIETHILPHATSKIKVEKRDGQL